MIKKIIKQLTNSNTSTLLMISHDDRNFTEFDTIINIDNFTIKKTK